MGIRNGYVTYGYGWAVEAKVTVNTNVSNGYMKWVCHLSETESTHVMVKRTIKVNPDLLYMSSTSIRNG